MTKVMEREADFGQSPLMGEPWPARADRSRLGADRYSRAVALLKRVLPTIGAALLLLVGAWPRLAPLIENARLGNSAIDLREARELKMIDPRYSGTDRLNRPYVVTAEVGRQVPNRSNLMALDRPRAVMIVHGGATVVLTAATGVYQSQAQLLDLFGDVTLTHQNGTRFLTQRAHANFADNTAEGHDPIEGHGPSGDIWGQGFQVRDNGSTIIFTGNSRLILKGTKPAKPASPPELPAGVANTAAAVEAAAVAPANPRSTAEVGAKSPQIKPARAHHLSARPHHIARHRAEVPAKPRHAVRKVEHRVD